MQRSMDAVNAQKQRSWAASSVTENIHSAIHRVLRDRADGRSGSKVSASDPLAGRDKAAGTLVGSTQVQSGLPGDSDCVGRTGPVAVLDKSTPQGLVEVWTIVQMGSGLLGINRRQSRADLLRRAGCSSLQRRTSTSTRFAAQAIEAALPIRGEDRGPHAPGEGPERKPALLHQLRSRSLQRVVCSTKVVPWDPD